MCVTQTHFSLCRMKFVCTYTILHTKFDVQRAVRHNIISIVKPTRCTNVSNLYYFGITLYMFRAVFPSIIRSSRLYIQQQAFFKPILLSACYQADSRICLTNACPSVHHQGFKTVHTATGICQTDNAVCLLLAGTH